MSDKVAFDDALEDEDWGLIIGKDGSLKGLFIPDGADDEEVPEVIVAICKDFFDIDPTEEVTMH